MSADYAQITAVRWISGLVCIGAITVCEHWMASNTRNHDTASMLLPLAGTVKTIEG